MATLYRKTKAGAQELLRRRLDLSVELRGLLAMIDGRSTVEELIRKAPSLKFDATSFQQLASHGLIEEVISQQVGGSTSASGYVASSPKPNRVESVPQEEFKKQHRRSVEKSDHSSKSSEASLFRGESDGSALSVSEKKQTKRKADASTKSAGSEQTGGATFYEHSPESVPSSIPDDQNIVDPATPSAPIDHAGIDVTTSADQASVHSLEQKSGPGFNTVDQVSDGVTHQIEDSRDDNSGQHKPTSAADTFQEFASDDHVEVEIAAGMSEGIARNGYGPGEVEEMPTDVVELASSEKGLRQTSITTEADVSDREGQGDTSHDQASDLAVRLLNQSDRVFADHRVKAQESQSDPASDKPAPQLSDPETQRPPGRHELFPGLLLEHDEVTDAPSDDGMSSAPLTEERERGSVPEDLADEDPHIQFETAKAHMLDLVHRTWWRGRVLLKRIKRSKTIDELRALREDVITLLAGSDIEFSRDTVKSIDRLLYPRGK